MTTQFRILVSTADRLNSGGTTPLLFDYDIGGMISGRNFQGKTVGCAVEWCDPIRYSPNADYTTPNANNGKGLLLELMNLTQANTWTTWGDNSSRALCYLQNWVESGYNGIQQTVPYVRRQTMGAVFNGDVVNNGVLRFRVSAFDGTDVLPADTGNNVEDFSFSIVFWELEQTLGGEPTYPWYRAWFNTANRLSGTVQKAVLQVDLKTNASWSLGRNRGEKWMCAVDFASTLKHDNATLSPGLSIRCQEFRRNDNYNTVFYEMLRSYRTAEEKYYGNKLSIHPLCSDHIGFVMDESPDRLTTVTLEVVDSVTGTAPDTPANLEDYVISIVFWPIQAKDKDEDDVLRPVEGLGEVVRVIR